jgi:hypothetical protein
MMQHRLISIGQVQSQIPRFDWMHPLFIKLLLASIIQDEPEGTSFELWNPYQAFDRIRS